jgi:glutamate---cysteine ligase / carboxylate-amine ligase
MGSLDLEAAREIFEASTDFTVGLEEEFQIIDPASLDLVQRFEEMSDAAAADPVLAEAVAGELISSEIEIRSGRGETFADAVAQQSERRARLFALAEAVGVALAAMGAHPWAPYLEQRIIDTPHYRRVEEGLRYVAWRNNTFSLHLHMGVKGADRAVAVCDAMRERLPLLLAASANSPFLDGRDTGLHSIRSQIFTRSFPRCGVHQPFGSWEAYREFVTLLVRTGSIVESTQLWWSVRPHHGFGTVELRICDAQSHGEESFGLAALIAACIAQAAIDYDDGALAEPLGDRYIEENMWRAIRFGMDGKLIDFTKGEELPAEAALEQTLHWTAPARAALGLEVDLPEANGAQRSRSALAAGASLEEAFGAIVEETRRTYAPEGVGSR